MSGALATPAPAGSVTHPLLEVQDVHKDYTVSSGFFGANKQQLHALDGVSLRVYEGKTLGVVGESGCGKSTLAKAVVMLEPPTAGKVLYQGKDIYTLQGDALKGYRRQVQFIFQDPYSSLPVRMSVGAILTEPLAIHGIGTPQQRAERASTLLSLVGLDQEDLKRYPHMFSGGQRQRICIARALALQPDEPVSALDVSIQAQILNLLRSLQREFDLTYLFISHDLSVVEHMSDRVAVMYLGKIVELADSADLYNRPLHPYTQALISAIPVPEPGRRPRRLVTGGDVPSPIDPPPGCSFHTRCGRSMGICREVVPVLVEREKGHFVACHLFD